MGHEITNEDHMVSANGQVPWHKLGTVVPGNLDSAEALRFARLEWTVDKVPVNVLGQRVENHWATVRSDTGRPLGIVGDRYVPIQNTDAFAWVDHLLGGEGFHIETAGSLRQGRVVWVMAKAPFTIDLPDSRMDEYVLLSTSHDGSSGCAADIVPIRVVCANTLRAALGSKKAHFSIRHTTNAATKLAEAQRVLGLTKGASERMAQRANELHAYKLSDADFMAFLDKLVAVPPKPTGRAATMTGEQRAAIAHIYNEVDDQQPIRGTAWGALNAVARYVDHVQPVRRGVGTADENRFTRSLSSTNLTDRAAVLLGGAS